MRPTAKPRVSAFNSGFKAGNDMRQFFAPAVNLGEDGLIHGNETFGESTLHVFALRAALDGILARAETR